MEPVKSEGGLENERTVPGAGRALNGMAKGDALEPQICR